MITRAEAIDMYNSNDLIGIGMQADAVRAKLRGAYRESFLGLRPGFVCILFTPEP